LVGFTALIKSFEFARHVPWISSAFAQADVDSILSPGKKLGGGDGAARAEVGDQRKAREGRLWSHIDQSGRFPIASMVDLGKELCTYPFPT
jgi:hypothetical protein